MLRRNPLSPHSEDVRWLTTEFVRDSVTSQPVAIGVSVDCVRIRLCKTNRDSEREREQVQLNVEYRQLLTSRTAQALLIQQLGLEGARARMRTLQTNNAISQQNSGSVMCRFSSMIDRVFEYFRVKNMKLEPFQIELMRGVVLGVAGSQLGDDLYKYKHVLLSKVGLAPLGSEAFDYVKPTQSHWYHIQKDFEHYANPYTLCLAPRQCGKSLMMRLLLASVLLHLDINVMVQAQNNHMCTTLRLGVESAMEELQRLPSFTETERPVGVYGSPENRIYRFRDGYKGSSFIHFLSSSNDVSITVSVSVLLQLVIYVAQCSALFLSLYTHTHTMRTYI